MASLDTVRGDLGLVVLYLSKAEARDKICRAIQYGSKFLSNGQPGPAQNVDKSTSLARKVFRLFKFVNDLQALISPPAKGTPLPLILLGKSKNAMLSTFLFLDQIVWAGRTGVYKNKERAEFLGRIAFYCFLGSNTCTTIIELAELQRLSKSMKKLEKDLKHQELYKNEQYRMKLKKSNERLLALIKSSLDIVVAVGLLQLAPKKVTPRVTGAFGFASSLIACYQVALRTTLRMGNTVGKDSKEQLWRSSSCSARLCISFTSTSLWLHATLVVALLQATLGGSAPCFAVVKLDRLNYCFSVDSTTSNHQAKLFTFKLVPHPTHHPLLLGRKLSLHSSRFLTRWLTLSAKNHVIPTTA
uniref:Peroxisomal membrane protein 11-5 n=1 Tax=Aegilops tauschii TaxID=37682 RepID=M8C3H6_AEGTA